MKSGTNSISDRRVKDREAVKRLADMLREVATDPGRFLENEDLLNALKSQGSLAMYAPPDSGFCRMSLNHQKAIAQEAIGEYEILNRLRKGALKALRRKQQSSKASKRPSRDDLESTISELREEVRTILEDLVLMQKALDTRSIQARNYALAANASVQALCAREQKEIETWLSLRKRPTNTKTVAYLPGAKQS